MLVGVLLLFSSGITPFFARAQGTLSNYSVTDQFWLDYNPNYAFGEKLIFYGKIGARVIFPHEWNRYVLRAAVKYKLPKPFYQDLYWNAELHTGLGLYFTNNLTEVNRLEIRPYQGFKLAWPNRKYIKIHHFVRLEERFDLQTNNWDNTFGLRVRYEAELTLRFTGKFIDFNKNFYMPIGIELFWNLVGVKQFNDAVRITPGIGYSFSPVWRGEFQFGYHYTRNTVEDVFATNDLVFRFRVYHRLEKKKEASP